MLVGFVVNKGFLFATSSQKIKNHAVESQITFIACLAMFESLTEKRRSINHMIIFNDVINKFYQCSIWGLCRGISMFFSIPASTKKCWDLAYLNHTARYYAFCRKKIVGQNINVYLMNFQIMFSNI